MATNGLGTRRPADQTSEAAGGRRAGWALLATSLGFGVVQLDEGIWWWSQLLDADVAALTAGTRVTIEFRRAGPSGEAIPVFKARLSKSEDHEGEGGGS